MKMILIMAVLVAALFAHGCVQNGPAVPRACTMEAKICPDGSAVGRQGPNCEFAACPAPLPQTCPNETKTCQDGSKVGRQGAGCAFAACPQANYTIPPANYTLYGKITIGPLCPVEPCNRTFDYGGVRVNVYDAASKNRVARVNADSSGYYGVNLAPGNYLVNVTDAAGNSFGLPSLDYTQSFTIEKGHMIRMDFDIDTGIR
ncbi:MAG: hypothetical protein NTX79_04330 [Candidatus Micrarchaeota archaeon]|nr:hypothetical protein [Candidatus Micrarchaeota archaeon]